MPDDPVLRSFEDLKDFPGSRKPINRSTDKVAPKVDTHWADKPVVYIYSGQSREFFTIRHLSAALNRSPVTIRGWENRGLLPESPYRSPAPRRGTLPAAGAPKGKRLWTRSQIEGLLAIAKETGCIVDDKQSPPNKAFTLKSTELFLALLHKES